DYYCYSGNDKSGLF
nr:immunoglobulin light chain junction region [Macaca mulatta]